MKRNKKVSFILLLFSVIIIVLILFLHKESVETSCSKRYHHSFYLESRYDIDEEGSTQEVNNNTELENGFYIPDSFSWSGGTGRVDISCNEVIVKSNQSYAKIVFSSPHYSYIKANGNIYYPSHSDDTSSFIIPVELNKNNQILGMTTAMSKSHEIAYNVFVSLSSGKKTDENISEINGLQFEEEINLEYAKYFKLYRYENDIVLLEINTESDTFQYLIIPKDTELPAGLEKEVTVIEKPVKNIYEGKYDELDYKKLVKEKCDLVILKSNTLPEKEKLAEIKEKLELLDIPLLIDCSEDEENERAKEEWKEIYNILFKGES